MEVANECCSTFISCHYLRRARSLRAAPAAKVTRRVTGTVIKFITFSEVIKKKVGACSFSSPPTPVVRICERNNYLKKVARQAVCLQRRVASGREVAAACDARAQPPRALPPMDDNLTDIVFV